jgi:hypothetical protein
MMWKGLYNQIDNAASYSGDPGGKASQFLGYCSAAYNTRLQCEQVVRTYKVLVNKPVTTRRDPTQLMQDASSGIDAARQITQNSLQAARAMIASGEISDAAYLAVLPNDPGDRISAADQAAIANSKQDLMYLLQSGNKQATAEKTLTVLMQQVDRYGQYALLTQMDAILGSLGVNKVALCKIYAQGLPAQGQTVPTQPLLDLLATSIFSDLCDWTQRIVDLAIAEATGSLTFTSPPPSSTGYPGQSYTGRVQMDNNRI